MSLGETKYVVLIEVDPLEVWRHTSKMMDWLTAIKPRIEILADAENNNSTRYGAHALLLERFESVRRLHSLARWAKANFRIDEEDVRLLEQMENGSLSTWFSNWVDIAGRSLGNK